LPGFNIDIFSIILKGYYSPLNLKPMAAIKGGTAIELGYARQLVDNYQKNKINHNLSDKETRAVWFSTEVILKALGLDPATIDPTEVSGLRIYFAAYEDKSGYPANPYDYNKMTLVMVQTGQNKTEIQRGTVSETVYYDIISDMSVQPSYPTSTPSPLDKTAYNDGQVNPPPDGAIGLGLMDW
jgi:hypothetical protein